MVPISHTTDDPTNREKGSPEKPEKGGEANGYKGIGGVHSLGRVGRDPGDATGTQPLMGSRI